MLSAADVHVAARLGELVGEESEAVLLAVALAVRGPRLGHVFVDLATIRDTASVESTSRSTCRRCPGRRPSEWLDALARRSEPASARAATDDADARPLRLLGTGCTSTATGARSARSPPT